MPLTYVWINLCSMQLKDLYGEKSKFISKNYKLYTKDGHGHSDITDWFKLCRLHTSTLATTMLCFGLLLDGLVQSKLAANAT